MVTQKFCRESRLLTPAQFQNVFNNATRFGSYQFTILITPNTSNTNRLGLAIAKKRVKLATQRNRIKRIVRESFRLNSEQLPAIDMVVMVKSGADKLDNHQLTKQLEYIWRKIIKKNKEK